MNSDIYFKIIWRQRSLACSSFDWAQYNIVNTIPKFTTSDQQASSNICRESWLKLPNPTYFGNLTMRDWFDLYLRLQLEVSVSILLNVSGFRVLYILSFVRKALNMFEFCKCPYKGWDIVVFIIYKLRKGNPFEADEDLTTKITRMPTFLFSKIKIWTGNSQAWSFLRHLESVGTQESEKCKVHFARCTNFSVYCAMGLRVLHRSEVRETSHVTPLFRDVSLITGSTNGMAGVNHVHAYLERPPCHGRLYENCIRILLPLTTPSLSILKLSTIQFKQFLHHSPLLVVVPLAKFVQE